MNCDIKFAYQAQYFNSILKGSKSRILLYRVLDVTSYKVTEYIFSLITWYPVQWGCPVIYCGPGDPYVMWGCFIYLCNLYELKHIMFKWTPSEGVCWNLCDDFMVEWKVFFCSIFQGMENLFQGSLQLFWLAWSDFNIPCYSSSICRSQFSVECGWTWILVQLSQALQILLRLQVFYASAVHCATLSF